MDLGTVIARGVLNEGDEPNVPVPNFDNARKKELESLCVCPNSCYSQFPEDEMCSVESVQLQMTEVGELEYRMHTCPYPASNFSQTLNCSFPKLSFA